MIHVQTYISVADNTGARVVISIRSLGGSWATVGDTVIAVVRESLPGIDIRRSEVVRAVVVRTRRSVKRPDGSRIRFNQNAAVIVNKDSNPRGSRIFGPVAQELRYRNFLKIISLSPEVILFSFMIHRLSSFYKEHVVTTICEKFSYPNIHKIPRLEKIVLNRGLGSIASNAKIVESSTLELIKISSQRTKVTYSRHSIAGFKIRRKVPIGVIVTLRSVRIYAFFDRFVNLTLPCLRDFYGLKTHNFDRFGNYNFGLKDQLIFPEIYDNQVRHLSGVNISMVTSSRVDTEGFNLLKIIGIPFRKV
jgi:large subunit ribosomal protein L5